MEHEKNNKVNYLDITINRGEYNLTYKIFIKPTVTGITIYNTSCHPHGHKKAAFTYKTY
jgi:hypothetical protein